MNYIHNNTYFYTNVVNFTRNEFIGDLYDLKTSRLVRNSYVLSKGNLDLKELKLKKYEWNERKIEWVKCVPNKFN